MAVVCFTLLLMLSHEKSVGGAGVAKHALYNLTVLLSTLHQVKPIQISYIRVRKVRGQIVM